MLYKRESAEILVDAMKRLAEGGNITNFNPGSTVRTILEVMTEETGRYYDVLHLNQAMGFLSTATGSYLDFIGNGLMGVTRGEPTKASANQEDRNVVFFSTDDAALSTHIPSQSIPAGTTISNSDATITYATTNDVSFNADQTRVFVPVEASDTGTAYNIGEGLLNTHSLSSGNVSVTNQASIGNGTDSETDSNYRFRIANSVRGYARANATSIRLAALSTPGVSDAIIQDTVAGVGTFDILVIPTGNTVSDSVLREVLTSVDFVKAVGVIGEVRQPDYVPVEIVVRLTFNNAVDSATKENLKRQSTQAILGYLGEIRLGGTLILNEIRQRVMELSSDILDMEILCYRFRRRPQLLRNYSLEYDELFVPDPNVSEPIKTV